jgi:streptogrisin C
LDVVLETAETAAEQASGLKELPVDFIELGEVGRFTPEETVKGGKQFYDPNGNDNCTTGFTARRNGVLGVVTARHCPDNLQYVGVPGVTTFVANASNSANGIIDLQFHRTNAPHNTVAKFRYGGPDDEATVLNVLNPVDNQTVCVHGIQTQNACSEVLNPNTCFDATTSLTYCGQVIMKDWITGGGDSGGPWFFLNTAFGIHSTGSQRGSTFTRIGTVANNLDATVLQQ